MDVYYIDIFPQASHEAHSGTGDARALHIVCATAHGPVARHIDGGGVCRDLCGRGWLGRAVGHRAVAVEGAQRMPVRETQQKSWSGTGKGQHMRVHAGILERAGGDSGAPLADGHRVEIRST